MLLEFKTGRHTPAFILLFLTDGEHYGGQILQRCKDELPFNPYDSAIVYRTLQKLEDEGAISVELKTEADGMNKKYYRLTDIGWSCLDDFYHDMQLRKQNLEFFLDRFEKKEKPQ